MYWCFDQYTGLMKQTKQKEKRENLNNISTQNEGQTNFLTMYQIVLPEQSPILSLTEKGLQ